MNKIKKYGVLKVTNREIFLTCPGSLNKKEYQYDTTWESLVEDDHTLILEVPQNGDYSIYAISDKKNNLREYRLVIDDEYDEYDEYEESKEINDVLLEDGLKILYNGFIYVDPNLMITDPASFVNGVTITTDIILKSKKDGESVFCDYGKAPNEECWVVYVFEILNQDDEVLEYRLLTDEDLVTEYSKLLENKENSEEITNNLSNVKI